MSEPAPPILDNVRPEGRLLRGQHPPRRLHDGSARRDRVGDRAERGRQVDAPEDDLRFLKPRDGSVVYRHDGTEHDITGLKPNRVTALGLSYIPQLDATCSRTCRSRRTSRWERSWSARGVHERFERDVRAVPAAARAPPGESRGPLGAASGRYARHGPRADGRPEPAAARRAVSRARSRTWSTRSSRRSGDQRAPGSR